MTMNGKEISGIANRLLATRAPIKDGCIGSISQQVHKHSKETSSRASLSINWVHCAITSFIKFISIKISLYIHAQHCISHILYRDR